MKISVVTPSYNQGAFIEATILSVLNQTRPPNEYIIMDGGSTDPTVSILNRYSNQLHFISEKDNGQTDALNKGFQLAQGEIIGWLNSDDVYLPNALAAVEAAFAADPQVDVVYGKADFINAQGKKIGRYPTASSDQKKLLLDCILCQPAVFFKRTLLTRYGYLNNACQYGMDYEFWLRLFTQGAKFTYIPHVLAQQRLHEATKTSSHRIQANKETCDLLKQYTGNIPLHRAIIYACACAKTSQNSCSFLKGFFHHFHSIAQHYQLKFNWKAFRDSVSYLYLKLLAKISNS